MKKLIAMLASFVMIVCTGILSFNAPAQASVVDDFLQVCNSQVDECIVADEYRDRYFSLGVVSVDINYLSPNFKEACIPTNPSTKILVDNEFYAAAELENGNYVTYHVEKPDSELPIIVCELDI